MKPPIHTAKKQILGFQYFLDEGIIKAPEITTLLGVLKPEPQ